MPPVHVYVAGCRLYYFDVSSIFGKYLVNIHFGNILHLSTLSMHHNVLWTFSRASTSPFLYGAQTEAIPLKRGIQVLDLGVCFNEKLSFKEHIHAKINKAYMMLGLIKRNFKYLTIPTFIQLYISTVRSHLDYCSSVWAPYRKEDIEALEKVQKRATKILPGLKNLPYSETENLQDTNPTL